MQKINITLKWEWKYDESPIKWECTTDNKKQSLLITKKWNVYSFYNKNFDVLFMFNNVDNKLKSVELKHKLMKEAEERGYYSTFTF